jgi:hypothetical protein
LFLKTTFLSNLLLDWSGPLIVSNEILTDNPQKMKEDLRKLFLRDLDKLEKENVELRKVNSSCKGILDNSHLLT